MSLVNQALYYQLGLNNTHCDDDRAATAGGTTQAGAAPIHGKFTRVLFAANATNNSMILKPAIDSGTTFVYVMNDHPNNPIQIFCAPGEKMAGVLNGSFSIAAGTSASFLRVPPHLSAADWRPSTIS